MFSVYPFMLWWLREYVYFVLLSSSNRKYELLLIVKGKVMKQWRPLFVFLYSFEIIIYLKAFTQLYKSSVFENAMHSNYKCIPIIRIST